MAISPRMLDSRVARTVVALLSHDHVSSGRNWQSRRLRELVCARELAGVANVVQIGVPAIALLALWLTRVVRTRSTEPAGGAAARLLGFLALLLPARDRERFVGEVLANMAGLRWRQRVDELLSVAGTVPGLAVILRWARRRGA
jgi:hypothetical protein